MYIPDGTSVDYGEYGREGRKRDDTYGIESIAEAIVRNKLNLTDIDEICKHTWIDSRRFENLYMWGWLGKTVESFGWQSNALKKTIIKKLKGVRYENVVDHYCGYHTCEICGKAEETGSG